MPQDRNTGAAGNTFGHETAPKIAAALGATMIGEKSNEAILNGVPVVIHCAGKKTAIVGVLYDHLERVDLVLGAFQHKDGSFDVYSLPSGVYSEHTRDSPTSGREARVGLVTKRVFVEFGKRIKVVRGI
jgi:hypothetical protein